MSDGVFGLFSLAFRSLNSRFVGVVDGDGSLVVVKVF